MFALAALLVAPLAVAASPLQKRLQGQATYYNVETGNAGSCGSMLHNSDFVVAMNQVQYDQSMCGQPLSITANGKTVQAVVMDMCPTGGGNCNYGDMDLSTGLFQALADLGVGKMAIEWNWGGSAPPPPPTTSAYVPPPTTTSTWQPPPSTSTPSSTPPSSSSSSSSSSSTQSSSTSGSEAAKETGSSNDPKADSTTEESNLAQARQAMLNMGEMVRIAGGLGA